MLFASLLPNSSLLFLVFFLLVPLQILNLTQALKDSKSPLHLVQMPPVIVETARSHQRSNSESYTQSFQSRKPFFSWW